METSLTDCPSCDSEETVSTSIRVEVESHGHGANQILTSVTIAMHRCVNPGCGFGWADRETLEAAVPPYRVRGRHV